MVADLGEVNLYPDMTLKKKLDPDPTLEKNPNPTWSEAASLDLTQQK